MDILDYIPDISNVDFGGQNAHHFAAEWLDRYCDYDPRLKCVTGKDHGPEIGLSRTCCGKVRHGRMIGPRVWNRGADPRQTELLASIEPQCEDVTDCRYIFEQSIKLGEIIVCHTTANQLPRLCGQTDRFGDLFDVILNLERPQLGHLTVHDLQVAMRCLKPESHLDKDANDE